LKEGTVTQKKRHVSQAKIEPQTKGELESIEGSASGPNVCTRHSGGGKGMIRKGEGNLNQ